MTEQEKKKKYKIACFSYGFLSLLCLLDEYEAEENYLECSLIYNAIRNLNNELGMDIPTKMSKSAIKYYHNSFRETQLTGHTKPADISNFIYYASIIKKEI